MPRMTGGEALARQLVREGVKVVFGLPGVQLYGALAGLRDERVRFITTRHEQATTYMADGYARAGGEGGFGTALVVPGPGLLNAAAGLSTAYSASSPVLMLCGQVPKRYIGRDVGVLHEVNDQMEAIAPVTKWRRRVLEVSDVPAAVRAAVRQLKSGRPRPVHLEFPPDVLEEEGDATLLPPAETDRVAASEALVVRAAEMLLAAQRPVIYAGGGAVTADAHEALVAVAEHLQAGIATTAEGKGVVSDANDLSLGAGLWPKNPLRRWLDAADLILVVGSRLQVAGFQPTQQVIQIDVDPDEIGRSHGLTFGLVGDARLTLERLLERLRALAPRLSRKAEREALRAEMAALDTTEPNAPILRSLRAGTPEDAIVIAGMTQIGYYSRPFWPVFRPRTYINSSYSGNLGFEYPTALGAKVAHPDRAVIAICGDGGFMYNAQEMSTAVKYGINVVAVVFNDNAYGNVARDLDEAWGGAWEADFRNPDFMTLAEAYGVAGIRVEKPTEVGEAVRGALALNRPALIEVRVGRMPRPPFFMQLKAPDKYKK
jgi:acetolactate synthase I/II/III large subunit